MSILRDWRVRAGYTQREVAEKLGCHHTYVSKLEKGTSDVRPSAAWLGQFAALVGAEADALCQALGVFDTAPLQERAYHNPALTALLRRIGDCTITDRAIANLYQRWRDGLE